MPRALVSSLLSGTVVLAVAALVWGTGGGDGADLRAPRSGGARRSSGPSLLPLSEEALPSPLIPAPANELLFLSAAKATVTPTPREVDRAACPADMLEIEGEFCPYVEQRCLRWLDPTAEPKLQCAEFAPTKKCTLPTKAEHFCIDRYEWPNQKGSLPAFSVTWYEAKDSCAAVGKRLCLDDEWTVACEGEERWPYPYGFFRNKEACNIDKTYIMPNPERYIRLETRAAELEKLDQREPSGSRESCVSPYGVADMAGNVDEWVVNETGHHEPHRSGLKGGYWGPVRTRCRPMTTVHEEAFHYYQVGFRCCADPGR